MILAKIFPRQKFPRTMKQDSKRHHYFCVEDEKFMRPIADTNEAAASRLREIDRERELRDARRRYGKRGDR